MEAKPPETPVVTPTTSEPSTPESAKVEAFTVLVAVRVIVVLAS